MSPGTKGTTTHQLYAATPHTTAARAATARAVPTWSPRPTGLRSPNGWSSVCTHATTWLHGQSFPGFPGFQVDRDPFEPDGPARALGGSPDGLPDQPGVD